MGTQEGEKIMSVKIDSFIAVVSDGALKIEMSERQILRMARNIMFGRASFEYRMLWRDIE